MLVDKSFARFIQWTVFSLFAGVALVMLFVVVVDPYRIYRLVEIPGFNLVKPSLDRYQSEIKVAGAINTGADVFLMGNSRIEVGLDPESKVLGQGKRSAYNLAIAGSGSAIAQWEFEQLRAARSLPSTLILGVEFIDFLIDPGRTGTAVNKQNTVIADLEWKIETLFSLSSVLAAVNTLEIQHDPEASIVTDRGFTPLLEYKRYVRDEGYNAIFRQRAASNAKNLALKPHGLFRTDSGTSSEREGLRALLNGAAREKVEVQLVIYPYHAQILAMFEQTGLWPVFEEWKELLVQEVERTKKLHPEARITLWDFSGFGEIQCERIPARGDNTNATKWYWEAGHFKTSVGDMILAKVLGNEAAAPELPQLGIPIGLVNLEQNRQRIARERRDCFANYPELFNDVTILMASSRRRD